MDDQPSWAIKHWKVLVAIFTWICAMVTAYIAALQAGANWGLLEFARTALQGLNWLGLVSLALLGVCATMLWSIKRDAKVRAGELQESMAGIVTDLNAQAEVTPVQYVNTILSDAVLDLETSLAKGVVSTPEDFNRWRGKLVNFIKRAILEPWATYWSEDVFPRGKFERPEDEVLDVLKVIKANLVQSDREITEARLKAWPYSLLRWEDLNLEPDPRNEVKP